MAQLKELLHCSAGWKRLLDNPALAKRVYRPQYHRYSEVYPDVYANDRRMLITTERWTEALRASEWQPETDANGLSVNFLTGGYDRLLSVSVHKKLPMSIGMEDNSELRKGQEVVEVDERFKQIMDLVGKILYSRKRPASARFRREASTSIPDFSVGSASKQRDLNLAMRYLLGSAPITPVSLLTAGLYPTYIIVNRFQDDLPGKERYSWTGFERVKVDASTPYSGHHGMRVRTAYAMSGTVSYIQTALMAEQREFYLNRFEFTYKHRTPDHVAAKLNRFKNLVGIDVTQFDQSVSAEHLSGFCDQLDRYWHPRAAALARLTLGGPSISACPFEAGKEDRWAAVGDPFEIDSYALTKGLPSGHPLNPDIGKFVMTCEILYRIDQLDPTALNRVEEILNGSHNLFGFVNSADDNLLMFNNEQHLEDFFKTKGTLQLDREKVAVFLGVVYGKRRGLVVGLPNLTSDGVRWNVPEQSIGRDADGRRPFFQTAFFERSYHYDEHFRYPDWIKVRNEAFRQGFGVTPDELIKGRREPIVDQRARTYADRMFLLNPSSIYYKLDIDDLSPDLAQEFAMRLAPEQVRSITSLLHTAEVTYDLEKPNGLLY